MLAVIEKLYAAITDSAQWPEALTRLADLVGGVDATLEWHRASGQGPQFFAAGGRLPQHDVSDYLAYYGRICPRIPYLAQQPPGMIGCDNDFLSEAEMDCNEFYADFLAPQDLRYFLSGCLVNDADRGCAFVAIHRSPGQGPASEADARRLSRVLPHLSRALDGHLRLASVTARQETLFEVFEHLASGVLLLDGGGTIIHANTKAREIFAAKDGLDVTDGKIRCSSAAAQRRIDLAVHAIANGGTESGPCSGDEIVVPRRSGRPGYLLSLRPLSARNPLATAIRRPAAIMFIDDPAEARALPVARIQAAYNLTPSEAALASALYSGLRLNDYAKARGVRVSTMRFHLYQAMGKMGVRRQSEMIELLSRLTTRSVRYC